VIGTKDKVQNIAECKLVCIEGPEDQLVRVNDFEGPTLLDRFSRGQRILHYRIETNSGQM
jgi:hypothetical protein